MGIGYSHEEQLLQKLYNHYKTRHNIPVTGGSNVVGGYSALEEYGNSVYSHAKEELIRGLAKDVSSILGLKNVDSGPLDVVIKKFKEVLPKPGTGKGTLKADSAKHEKLCGLLAKAINKRYGMNVVDEHADAHQICQRVAELMYSLFTGLHSEFLTVAGDVSRIVKNLETLQGIVDGVNNKVMNELAKSGDDLLSSEAENSKILYKKITDEIKRQHVMLSNIINSSIGPVGSSLITVLAENKDFTGLVEDLKKTTGTQMFGDRLAQLLSGISSIAHSANLVDKALKKIGLSVADYKNTKGIHELRDKVYNSILKKKPNSGEMHKLLVAADILYRNDLAHDDIANHLMKKSSKMVGGASEFDPVDSSFADMVDDTTWNDSTQTPFSGRTQSFRKSIGKQLREQKKYRNILFSDFNNQIKNQYHAIISLISKLSHKIGKEIPVSDKLERYVRLLSNFASIQPERKNLHIALSGFRTDSASSFIKNRYLDYLDLLKTESDDMSKEGGPIFKELANLFGRLLKVIDDFNINFTKTLSGVYIDEGPRMQSAVGGKKKKIKQKGARENNLQSSGNHLDMDMESSGNHLDMDMESSGNHLDMDMESSGNNLDMDMESSGNNLDIDMENSGNNLDMDMESSGNHLDVDKSDNKELSEILGGVIEGYPADNFRYFMTLRKSIREIDYNFRIANIKKNMNRMAVENKANVDNYESILGEEAGAIIDEINQKYNVMVASANGNTGVYSQNGFNDEKSIWLNGYTAPPIVPNRESLPLPDLSSSPPEIKALTPMAGNFMDLAQTSLQQHYSRLGAMGEQYKQGYLFLLEYIRTAKIEMLEAAQAVDLYLSQFTQNIESNPDTIKDFVEIVEQLEVVAKWFTDKSGDHLVGVFEAFSKHRNLEIDGKSVGRKESDLKASLFSQENYILQDIANYDEYYGTALNYTGSNRNDLKSDYNIQGNYYDQFSKNYNSPSNGYDTKCASSVGIFYKPMLLTREQAIQFVKQLEKSIKGVRALENIISIFNKVNTQSSGDIKTFMNAGMIFKAFMKYCVASVIGIGFRVVLPGRQRADVNYPVSNPSVTFSTYTGHSSGAAQYNDIAVTPLNAILCKTGVTLRFCHDFIKLDAKSNIKIKDNRNTNSTIPGTKISDNGGITPTRLVADPSVDQNTYNAVFNSSPPNISSTSTSTPPPKAVPAPLPSASGTPTLTPDALPTANKDLKPTVNPSIPLVESSQPSLTPSTEGLNSFEGNIDINPVVHTGGDNKTKVDATSSATSGKLLRLCDPFELKQDLVSLSSTTDKIFEMSIKAMVSKIFVVIGSHSLFHKPPKGNLLNKSINASFATNPLRQIIGGSQVGGEEGGSVPISVIPDALELYIRLPLLVEWYRQVFEFNVSTIPNANDYKRQMDPLITMIPEMDNIWRDLCMSILVDGSNIVDGIYPSEVAKKILSSITDIYKHYKSKKSSITCKEIIQEFVFEVNRRYGFMMRSEIQEYLRVRNDMVKAGEQIYEDDSDRVDFDLLDSENQIGRRTAPSDRFRGFSASRPGQRQTLTLFYNAVRRFRQSVEANLLMPMQTDSAGNPIDYNMSIGGDVDMDEVIRLTKKMLDNAKTPEEQYNVIYSHLHSINKFSNIDQNKLLVFHETVVNPLTLLYFVYLLLNNYNALMVSMNLEQWEQTVVNWIDGRINNHGYVSGYIQQSMIESAARQPGSEVLSWNEKLREAFVTNTSRIGLSVYGSTAPSANTIAPPSFAIQLVEFNHSKFKSNEAKQAYGLDDTDYASAVHCGALLTPDELARYFGVNKEFNIYSTHNAKLVDLLVLHGTHGNTNKAAMVELMKRFCLQRNVLMTDVLLSIQNIACELNGLVDVVFPGESKIRYPTVNFSKLEDVCLSLFSSAKQSLSKLRKSLPVTLLNQFESNRIGTQPNVVSVFYLQEHLFDRLFKNKYGNGLDDGNVGLKSIWVELTKEHKFNYVPNADIKQGTTVFCARGIPIKIIGKNTENYSFQLYNSSNAITATGNIDPRKAGDIPSNQDRTIQKSSTELNQNPVLYEALHREYCFDSYNSPISKLLFWDVQFNEYNGYLPKFLNTAQVGTNGDNNTFIFNQSSMMEFPTKFLPIFNDGGSVANVKDKDKSTMTNLNLYANDYTKYNNISPKLNNKIVPTIPFIYSGKSYPITMCGFRNIYDYDTSRSNLTMLNSDKFGYYTDGTSAISNIDRSGNIIRTGLLVRLNNMIYKYINVFMDKASDKIYRPLIEKFINGYNSKDIMQGKNINDIAYVIENDASSLLKDIITDSKYYDDDRIYSVIHIFEPPKNSVIFATLAAAIKTIYTAKGERVSGNYTMFTQETLADVPEYQKEMMRAYLPIFEKQFEMLIKRAEFLKQVMDQTSCKVYKSTQHSRGQYNPSSDTHTTHRYFTNTGGPNPNIQFNLPTQIDPSFSQPLRTPQVEHESSRKSYLIGLANDLIATSKSLLSCINVVQKELADVPLFFETYKDSISDFNNRNQSLPVMPLSLLTHLMNFNIFTIDRDTLTQPSSLSTTVSAAAEYNYLYNTHLLPNINQGIGSTSFKFAYGTRGILSHKQKPSLDYAPAVASLLESHTVGGNEEVVGGVAKSPMSGFAENSILLSRFILDTLYHSEYLGIQNYSKIKRLMYLNSLSISATDIKNLSCFTGKYSVQDSVAKASFWSNSENVLMLVENENIRQAIYRIISCIRQSQSNPLFDQDRAKLRIFNILDLNIVPINFHALQREIPFANIMNYAHTFDHIVKNTIGVSYNNRPLTDIHGAMPLGITPNGTMFDSTIKIIPSTMEEGYSYNEFMNTSFVEDQLTRHLIYPFCYTRYQEFFNDIHDIMAGNTSLSINRPKYLSDQLWNKVLLQDLIYIGHGNIPINNEARRVANLRQDSRSTGVTYRKTLIHPLILNLSNVSTRGHRLGIPLYSTRGFEPNRTVQITENNRDVTMYANQNLRNDIDEPLMRGISTSWYASLVMPTILDTKRERKPSGSTTNIIARLNINLSYINNEGKINYVEIGGINRMLLANEGYMRYNTRLVRWIEWTVHVQRLISIILRKQLEWVQDPVVSKYDALSEGVTEFNPDNRGYMLADFE